MHDKNPWGLRTIGIWKKKGEFETFLLKLECYILALDCNKNLLYLKKTQHQEVYG